VLRKRRMRGSRAPRLVRKGPELGVQLGLGATLCVGGRSQPGKRSRSCSEAGESWERWDRGRHGRRGGGTEYRQRGDLAWAASSWLGAAQPRRDSLQWRTGTIEGEAMTAGSVRWRTDPHGGGGDDQGDVDDRIWRRVRMRWRT
jgi:hypothetical protein